MRINEVNDFFNKKALKIKFQYSIEPLPSTLKDENIERYKAIPLSDRNKSLNLKIISKTDNFNDFYISVMNDKKANSFIIFYRMYKKYITNYTSYEEISTKDDLYRTILSLLKDNDADPEAISEKVIFE